LQNVGEIATLFVAVVDALDAAVDVDVASCCCVLT